MQILSKDVEAFCVHVQKILIVMWDNKVIQSWIICTYLQILNRDVDFFAYLHRNSLINSDLYNSLKIRGSILFTIVLLDFVL